jgi:hypothetical protein
MIRKSRQEKKLLAAMRAEFALKQRLERIDHEEDYILPRINDYLSRASLPEPPTDLGIKVDFEVASAPSKRRKK